MEAALALAHPDSPHALARSVVAASGLTRRYGAGETAVDALRGVSLEIARGHLTAVMGPSGSGKSTLMHILAGLDKPSAGTVSIDGVELTTLKDNDLTKLRRRHIGFVFQFFNLLPMLTAEENVTLPLSIAGEKTSSASQAGSGVSPAMADGSRMFSSAVSIGSRLKNWNTKPMWRRRSFVSAVSLMAPRSWPATRTRPQVGRSSPASRCMSVDLPEPDGPMIAVRRPAAMSSDTSSSASTVASPSP